MIGADLSAEAEAAKW